MRAWDRRRALGGLAAAGALAAAGRALGAGAGADGALAKGMVAGGQVRLVEGVLTQGGWARGLVARGGPGAAVQGPGVQGLGVQGLALGGQPVPLAADGRFFLAFDRDCPAHCPMTITLAGGLSLTHDLAIDPRHWQIEAVDAPFHPPALPDATFAAIRAGEMAQITAARAQVTGAQGWRQRFIRPAPGRFSGRFGDQRIYRGTPGSYHSGLDIAAGAGTPYVAPADGVVVLAASAPFTLEGNLLMLDHGNGLSSAFLHAARLLVKAGDAVAQGQPLGEVGMTGRATGPHLHWSLRWYESRLDPLLLLAGAAV